MAASASVDGCGTRCSCHAIIEVSRWRAPSSREHRRRGHLPAVCDDFSRKLNHSATMASVPAVSRCSGGILHKTSVLIRSRARGQAMCFQPWFTHELQTGLRSLFSAASSNPTRRNQSRLTSHSHGRGYSVVASSDAPAGKYMWKDSSKVRATSHGDKMLIGPSDDSQSCSQE